MVLPKARNLILGIAIVVLLLAAGMVIAQDQETLRVRTSVAAEDQGFPQYLSRLLGHPLTSGDAYTVLTNGDAAFPVMLSAIASARHRIRFEGYIYDSTSEVGERFTSAFEAAARRGVDVELLFDSVGGQVESAQVERLERAGCKIGWFNRVRGPSIEEVNYRTHRKALIVDGDVAFVGGIGIADQWARDTPEEQQWRDTHVELRGRRRSTSRRRSARIG
jgi:cardiolipin synthase